MSERFTIVTTMKNEGPFMLEWIAYNRAIGFTDFLIFTNDCADGTDMIAKRLNRLGIITHVPNPVGPRQSPQRKALRSAGKHPLVQGSDWVICADVDEFLNIRAGNGHLDDLMAAVGPVDAISFCWKLFGNGGRVAFEGGFVTDQFRWACPEDYFPVPQTRGLKTLFRMNGRFSRMAIHRPRIAEEAEMPHWVDAGGQPMPPIYKSTGWAAYEGFSHTHARLHHYAIRSADSFLVKRDRGRTNHIDDDQGGDYWARLNFNFEQDDSILARLPAARVIYDEMMDDPRIAKWHTRAVNWHRKRITALKSEDHWARFHAAIATHGMASLAQGLYMAAQRSTF